MKLTNFQIKNYKVILDTQPVKVDPRVTALVGKNESGKTAVLKAMWKSHNISGAAFDKLYDYPRDRYSVDRKSTQEVTILKFDLLPEETEDLVSHLSQAPAADPKRIVYTTFYDGEDEVRKEVKFDKALQSGSSGADARAAIEAVTKVIAAQDGEDLDPVHAASTNALEQVVEEAPLWETATITALETFNAAATTWFNADPARQAVAGEERQHLAQVIAQANQGDPDRKACEWAEGKPSDIHLF